MNPPPSLSVRSALDAVDATDAADPGRGRASTQVASSFPELTAEDQQALLNGLAARAANDSAAALELLLELVDHHRLADPGIRRILADDGVVDEVAADVLIAVARSIGSFQQRSSFRTWLYAIGSNQAKLFLRGRERRPTPTEPVDQASVAMKLSSFVARREDLSNALATLPDVYRQAVILRDVEQLPYEDVAQALGITVNTVRSRIHRGRAMIVTNLALVD